jgi:hypothetical protein
MFSIYANMQNRILMYVFAAHIEGSAKWVALPFYLNKKSLIA